jgi:hypothetical protein
LQIKEQLRQLKPYQPGKPIEEVKMEYAVTVGIQRKLLNLLMQRIFSGL